VHLFFDLKNSTVGKVSALNVSNLNFILSTLSSLLPEYLARDNIRFSSTSYGHSNYIIWGSMQSLPNISYHPSILFNDLGNPSSKKFILPSWPITSYIAFFSNVTVISLGTNWPAVIYFSIVSAVCPPFFLSALNRSPVDKCVQPNWFLDNSHMVPLPAPGPPNTNTTFGLGVGCLGSK